MPFVLPTVVVGVAFRLLVGESGPLGFLGLDGTPVAIIAGLAFFNVAVVIRAVGAAWESLDPRPGEAAAALGAEPGPGVPHRHPAGAAARRSCRAASVVFLFCATSFGVVLTLGGLRYSSVETEIYLLTTQLLDLQAAAALSILQLLAITALLVVAGRLRAVPDPTVERSYGAARGGLGGRTLAQLRAHRCWCSCWSRRRSSRSSSARCASTTRWSLEQLPRGSPRSATATRCWSRSPTRWSPRCGPRSTRPGCRCCSAALIAVVVSRRSLTRGERRLRSTLDGFFMLPLGVSAVTLGFGFLITLDQPPLDLRDSPLLVPIAQALVALPLVVRTLVPVLAGIDDRQRQAAASLGAGPLRAFATVDLPVVWRPLLAAAGFAFAVSLGEFGATSFLARDEHPTLPVVIYQLIGRPGARTSAWPSPPPSCWPPPPRS